MKNKSEPKGRVLILKFLLFLYLISSAVHADSSLEHGFYTPPHTAKPKTWLHAMSGNMSKAGFTKDLEAIAEAGLGGVLLFNVSHGIPKGDVIFNSPLHHDIIQHAAAESERLGLSFGVHNCDGWTSSGGPWISPKNAMKMLVWSESVIEGGKVNIQLPLPTSRHDFYRDVAVIAYPSLDAELYDAESSVQITSSDRKFDTELAQDGRWDDATILRAKQQTPGWLLFDFGSPRSARSLSVSLHKTIAGSRNFQLLASNDGKSFTQVLDGKLKRLGKREFAIEETFPEVSARYFKLNIEDDYEISEVALRKRENLSNYLARSSLFKVEDHKLTPIRNTNPTNLIASKNIRQLSKYMSTSGKLKVTLPQGKWTILRFGYTTTGAVNSPASEEGRGLEVDKMDAKALDIHYRSYVKKIVKNTQKIAPNALQYVQIDSYEVGGQNWTRNYEKLFQNEYNYSLLNFLPLYTGRIVNSAVDSMDVLSDIRRFNSRLITENYFGHFQKLARRDGLVTYLEPYSFNGPFNELDAGKYADIPMGEFWMHQRYQTGTAVSSARIYGKPVISAESFSAQSDINWRSHPGFAKPTGDKAWTLGINEFMFHRYAHQANTHVTPGMTMSRYGSHIDRTQTWWKNAGATWFKYIARGSYMLRQGNPVSDLLVFVGEGSPSSVVDRKSFEPNIPNKINFDSINSDALINRISYKNGLLTLPEGTSYKMLVLSNSDKMSMNTLEKIASLSAKGAIIIGKKPERPIGYLPSISIGERRRFQQVVERVWKSPNTYQHFDWEKIYREKNIAFDFTSSEQNIGSFIHRKKGETDIYFFANPTPFVVEGTFGFRVTNKIPEIWDPMTGKVRKLAQYHDDQTHTRLSLRMEPKKSLFVVFRERRQSTPYVQESNLQAAQGHYLYDNKNRGIHLVVSANGKYRANLSDGSTWESNVDKIPPRIEITTPWMLDFSTDGDFSHRMKTKNLFDWSRSEIFDIKHYSGTVLYENEFILNDRYFQSDLDIFLDLGKVNVTAKIFINGKLAGLTWSHPHRIQIEPFLKKGKNSLKVEVTNTWTNRLIGDEHYPRTDGYAPESLSNPGIMPSWYVNNHPMPPSKRQTFTTYNFYTAGDTLEPSGLVGPVSISAKRRVYR